MSVVFDGIAVREERRHNDLAWLAWHTAFMTSYAPQKQKKFWKLKTLFWRSGSSTPTPETRKPDWKKTFAAFSAWANSKEKKK